MPTFADFLTPAGLVIAAGVVTTLVEIIKTVFPPIDARISGALMALVLSAVLYVLTGLATISVPSLDAGLGVFLAWLGCATAAIGIKSAVSHAQVATGGKG